MSGAQPAGDVGPVELIGHRIIRIRRITAIGRIMLPVAGFAAQVRSGYLIEIIYINIDVIAIMLVAAVIIMIVIVMVIIIVVVIVIIPVNVAENRVGCRHAQAIAKATHEAIGKLFPGGGGR